MSYQRVLLLSWLTCLEKFSQSMRMHKHILIFPALGVVFICLAEKKEYVFTEEYILTSENLFLSRSYA